MMTRATIANLLMIGSIAMAAWSAASLWRAWRRLLQADEILTRAKSAEACCSEAALRAEFARGATWWCCDEDRYLEDDQRLSIGIEALARHPIKEEHGRRTTG